MGLKNLDFPLILQFITLVCLPLYVIRFSLPFTDLPTTLLEILILLTVLITALRFYQDGLPWPRLKTHFNILILLILINGLVSVLVSPDIKGGFGIYKEYFLEPVLFYFALFFTAQKKGLNYIIQGLFLAGFWLFLLAILQKITGQFSLAPHEILQGRVSGVYNSANSLALFLGPIIFLALAYLAKTKSKSKLFYLGLVGFFSLTIIWTKSRGGLIGEVVSLLIFGYGLASARYQELKKLWFIVPAVLTLVITIFFYQMFEIYDSSTSIQEIHTADTLQIRFALWNGTTNLLKEHPLFGAGLSGFKDLYSQSYKISPFQEDLQYPHNIFLNFWTETGIFGLIIFLLILIRSFRLLLHNIFQDFYLGLGLICALIFIIIHGLVDVPYFKNDLSIEFWVIICLVELWTLKLAKARN